MKMIELKMFGAFRKYIPEGKLEIILEQEHTVKDLKLKLQETLLSTCKDYTDKNLVFESAMASEEEILTDESVIKNFKTLAILPPVCGG